MSTATIEKPSAPKPATHIGPEVLYPTEQKLDASHRCDAGAFKPANLGGSIDRDQFKIVESCGTQAAVAIEYVTGELEFCAHHFKAYADSISKKALRIRDERAFLLPQKQPYKGNGLN
jgi:hypothetical protein